MKGSRHALEGKRQQSVIILCDTCGTVYIGQPSTMAHNNHCKDCRQQYRRLDRSPLRQDGYVKGTRDKLQHQLVAEEMLGRPLRHGEIVHHKNEDRADNDPSNLEVVTTHEHALMHRGGEKNNQAKLTDKQVAEIVANPAGLSIRQLSNKYHVSTTTISNYRSGRFRTWVLSQSQESNPAITEKESKE